MVVQTCDCVYLPRRLCLPPLCWIGSQAESVFSPGGGGGVRECECVYVVCVCLLPNLAVILS